RVHRDVWPLVGLARGAGAAHAGFARVARDATGGRGVDVVLDLVGGAYLEGNLQALARRGRMIVVGLVAGRSATLDLGLLLSKRLSLRGTVLRSRSLAEKVDAARAFARDVIPLLESGRVRPIVDEELPAWEAKRAHRRLETNETYGKLVLTW